MKLKIEGAAKVWFEDILKPEEKKVFRLKIRHEKLEDFCDQGQVYLSLKDACICCSIKNMDELDFDSVRCYGIISTA